MLRDLWRAVPPASGREAQDLLDEWLGVAGWEAKYRKAAGAVRCRLSLIMAGRWWWKHGQGVGRRGAFDAAFGKWRAEMSETRGQIYELLPKVAKAIGPIAKSRRNQAQGYNFRGVEDIINELHPIFVEHGLTLLPKVDKVVRETRTTKSGTDMAYTVLEVSYRFVAPDGSMVEASVVGEGSDTGDKSANKAMSAALKYALGQVFLIPFEMVDSEDDRFEKNGKTAPAGQQAGPRNGSTTSSNGQPAKKPGTQTAVQNNLPADGTAMVTRLQNFEATMVGRGQCAKDDLMKHIQEKGRGRNYSATLRDWTGDAIVWACAEAVAFQKERQKLTAKSA